MGDSSRYHENLCELQLLVILVGCSSGILIAISLRYHLITSEPFVLGQMMSFLAAGFIYSGTGIQNNYRFKAGTMFSKLLLRLRSKAASRDQ